MSPPGNGMVPFPQKECPPRVCVSFVLCVLVGTKGRPRQTNHFEGLLRPTHLAQSTLCPVACTVKAPHGQSTPCPVTCNELLEMQVPSTQNIRQSRLPTLL